jgi:uncharacterized membrane protein YqaE (UPF0057 family)
MRYVLAIVLPPVAFFTMGKPFQGILNLVLMVTLIGWPIAAIWALVVVNQWKNEQGQKKVVAELKRNTEMLEAQNAALAAQTAATIGDRQSGGGPTAPGS